jgi:subtilisin-like proprotein convertase family protein
MYSSSLLKVGTIFVASLICLIEIGQGASVTLDLPADLHWWNGCSPTVAGMLFGWWEEHGYDSFPGSHRNVPANYPFTSTSSVDYDDARGIIAGWTHKQQGIAWGLAYGSYLGHPPSSLADFLLTQNGETVRDDIAHGLESFGAWDDPRTPEVESHRFVATTAYTDGGWTYDDYVAEIDEGRPVFLGLQTSQGKQHGMLGVGYDNTGGKKNIKVLTTAGEGVRTCDWSNVPYAGAQYSVYSATLMRPDTTATPQLSAYLSIAHPYLGDLEVEIGVGNPLLPTWKKTLWNRGGGGKNLVLTDIDCTDMLSAASQGNLYWYLKVTDAYSGLSGTVENFQIRYGRDRVVYKFNGKSVPINDLQTSYLYLQAGTQSAGGVLDADVRDGGVLSGSNTIHGLATIYSGGTLAAVAGSPLTVDRVQLEDNARLISDAASSGGGLTVKQAISWNGKIIKSGLGEYELILNGGVALTPDAILDVAQGSLTVGGTVDPFTDTSDPTRHLSLNIERGAVANLRGTAVPVLRNVTVLGTLNARSLVADTISIGGDNSSASEGYRPQIPEPNGSILLLGGLAGCLARLVFRRIRLRFHEAGF